MSEFISFTSTWSDTWEVPTWVTNIDILVVAGWGGAGRGTTNSTRNAWWGWGGWVVFIENYSVTPWDSISLTVGTGGSGSLSDFSQGSSGWNSSFGSLTALGGWGGASSSFRDGLNGGSWGGGGRLSINYGIWGTGLQTSQSGDSWIYGFGNNWVDSSSDGAGGGGGAWWTWTITQWGAWISIFWTVYAKWGDAESNWANGASNTGNGGNAQWITSGGVGGNGGSGIVIIRTISPKSSAWFLMRNF